MKKNMRLSCTNKLRIRQRSHYILGSFPGVGFKLSKWSENELNKVRGSVLATDYNSVGLFPKGIQA